MTKSLELWAHVVLELAIKGGTIELTDGREAEVKLEDDCLIAYTYEGEGDELVVHQRIRLVVENPAHD